jgi:iron complex transport system substrate-binding protein
MSLRIASLLPSATESVFELGLGDQLVGVTHECDYPAAARALPVLTRSLIPAGLSSAAIDAAVVASQRDEHTIYALDADLLARLEPDLVLTQSLCEVCAVPRSAVEDAVCTMPGSARVISLDPSSVGEMIEELERLAAELGVPENGARVAAELRRRLGKVESRAASAPTKPRVFCAEWLDPIFCAGHWLPEMVAIAGGEETRPSTVGIGAAGVVGGARLRPRGHRANAVRFRCDRRPRRDRMHDRPRRMGGAHRGP